LWFPSNPTAAQSPLWVLLRVSHGSDVEPQHHRVVFVDSVVTVHWIAAKKIAEAEKQFDLGIVLQPDYVFSTRLDQRTTRRRRSVDQQCLELFEVNMDGMLPAA